MKLVTLEIHQWLDQGLNKGRINWHYVHQDGRGDMCHKVDKHSQVLGTSSQWDTMGWRGHCGEDENSMSG